MIFKFSKKLLTLLALIFISQQSFAQKNDVGNWFLYLGNQKLNKKFNWHNEVQYRNYNFVGDLQQLLLRTGIGYDLSENNNNLLMGYGFIRSENYIPNTDEKIGNNEHRIYQQFITKQTFGRVNIQHRYRVEERFLESDFQLRFRYFLSLNVPLNNKKLEDKTVYLSAYNEIFIKDETPSYDRNRLYGGLGYVINKNFRVELGYLNQATQANHRNQFQIMFFNNFRYLKTNSK
ncbi:DUF2490 domain-containing protein [Pedobacter alpinus]|uniref:DUF2490 domain-containing protein n=1 Tax=Pedobacter alpinus TaxID=1590643 RepID=A0ABW5TV70_9SPHI